MSTFSQMTDQTLMQLYGYTTLQDQATYLTANVASGATTATVNDVTAISRGIVEIDDELIWVDDINSSTNSLTIPPYGRGFRGTTAVAHTSGTRVTSSPMFPRYLVKNAINDAIKGVYPELFAVSQTNITFQPAITTYALPVGALDVLQLTWQTTGPSKEWLPIRRMRVDKHAATSVFTSGVTVSVYDSIVPGATMKAVFTKEPSVMSNDGDDFTTVTGLPSSCEDVIRLGAAYRLTPYFDAPQIGGNSAQADFADQNRTVGQAASLSRFLLQMYQVRFQEEVNGLQKLYPVRSYYTR